MPKCANDRMAFTMAHWRFSIATLIALGSGGCTNSPSSISLPQISPPSFFAASPTLAPVTDLTSNDHQNTPTTYIVQPGDTLANIAARHHYSYKQIVQWNRLQYPYTIHEGQKLSFYPAPIPASERPRGGSMSSWPPQPSAQGNNSGDLGEEGIIATPLQ